MASDVHIRDARQFLRSIRKEILRELRVEANRVRKNVRAATPKRTGTLNRKIKVRTGWDATGPYARITTTARNPKTRFRYGLAIQQRTQYLERGLQRTPRR